MKTRGDKPARPGRSDCSVCIANYNGEAFIKGCIDSVLEQKCELSFEIILHDDASEDNSLELVKRAYPEVVIIESRENVGFCESNNRMARAAKGEYLLLLNNDAELMPGALSTLHAYARELTGPAILTLPQYDYETGALVDRGSLVDPVMNPVPNMNADRREVAMAIGACLWIPRALWHQLGGFPSWFESLAEDMYLCTVARTRGVNVHVVNGSGYLHRYGASFGGGKVVSNSLDTTIRRRRLSERNKSYTMVVCYPVPWLHLILPLHLLALIGEGLFLSVAKRNFRIWRDVYWNCLHELWRNRHQLREQRRTVQKRRTVSAARFFSTTSPVPRKLVMLFRYGIPAMK